MSGSGLELRIIPNWVIFVTDSSFPTPWARHSFLRYTALHRALLLRSRPAHLAGPRPCISCLIAPLLLGTSRSLLPEDRLQDGRCTVQQRHPDQYVHFFTCGYPALPTDQTFALLADKPESETPAAQDTPTQDLETAEPAEDGAEQPEGVS